MAISNSVTLLIIFQTLSKTHISGNSHLLQLLSYVVWKKFIVEDNWVSNFNWRLSIYYRIPVVEKCLKISVFQKDFLKIFPLSRSGGQEVRINLSHCRFSKFIEVIKAYWILSVAVVGDYTSLTTESRAIKSRNSAIATQNSHRKLQKKPNTFS